MTRHSHQSRHTKFTFSEELKVSFQCMSIFTLTEMMLEKNYI
jgi:hypothetical protein